MSDLVFSPLGELLYSLKDINVFLRCRADSCRRYAWARIIIAIVAIAVSPSDARSEDLAGSWKGTYTYEYSGGKSKPGTGIVVSYRLDVHPDNTPAPALLSISGYQVDETLICDLVEDAHSISVLFKSYESGEILNRFGVATYIPGQMLFRLDRTNKGGSTPVTVWGELRPDKSPVTGVFFKRD
jgi:hypothetical protein